MKKLFYFTLLIIVVIGLIAGGIYVYKNFVPKDFDNVIDKIEIPQEDALEDIENKTENEQFEAFKGLINSLYECEIVHSYYDEEYNEKYIVLPDYGLVKYSFSYVTELKDFLGQSVYYGTSLIVDAYLKEREYHAFEFSPEPYDTEASNYYKGNAEVAKAGYWKKSYSNGDDIHATHRLYQIPKIVGTEAKNLKYENGILSLTVLAEPHNESTKDVYFETDGKTYLIAGEDTFVLNSQEDVNEAQTYFNKFEYLEISYGGELFHELDEIRIAKRNLYKTELQSYIDSNKPSGQTFEIENVEFDKLKNQLVDTNEIRINYSYNYMVNGSIQTKQIYYAIIFENDKVIFDGENEYSLILTKENIVEVKDKNADVNLNIDVIKDFNFEQKMVVNGDNYIYECFGTLTIENDFVLSLDVSVNDEGVLINPTQTESINYNEEIVIKDFSYKKEGNSFELKTQIVMADTTLCKEMADYFNYYVVYEYNN